MVRGLNNFKKHFREYADNYVIIGGTACDIIIEEAGFNARATKDIDVILIVEALTPDFVKQFWQFIKDGKYERQEKSEDERNYYRFIKPEDETFPKQIELFSRTPDTIDLDEGMHLTPIPVDDDLSSLSAILLDDIYYGYMVEHSTVQGEVRFANTEALMCLKAKAYLEIEQRIAEGGIEEKKHLRKHKGDVFRLAVLMTAEERYDLPELIKSHFKTFMSKAAGDLPDKSIFKEMGIKGISIEKVYDQIMTTFKLA
ncbi:hypothetical protein ABIB62_004423 [Mucilaginibacter sp. UYP25]|uniref:hypothetical protein n=1 Tax=unclassified Mucilaginibacter TaxID=2617802 RepID=UPI0033955255